MSQKKRIITYVALCYFVMSAILFGIFTFTYSHYFYKIQEQMILKNAEKGEELYLKTAMEKLRTRFHYTEIQRKQHERIAKSIARDKLDDLIVALNSKSDPVPLPNAEKEKKKVDPAQVFLEDADDLVLTEVPKFKPVKKSDLEKPFLDVFNRMSANGKEMVELRRFAKGLDQMVDMSYIQVDKRKVKLYKEGETIDWEIRAYAVPFKSADYSFEDDLLVLKKSGEFPMDRFAIFKNGQKDALFKGKSFVGEASEVQFYFDKAEKASKATFGMAPLFGDTALKDGNDQFVYKMTSYMVDPEMNLAIVAMKSVFESEWMQFSFINRNWIPITIFIILAWVICPVVGWIAYKMASEFKFNYTVDLEGDEGELPSRLEPKPMEELPKVDMEEVNREVEEQLLPDDVPVLKPTEKKSLSVDELAQMAKEKKTEASAKQIDPPPFERVEINQSSVQMDSQDLDQIRTNNIRKSTGSFNRHKEGDGDTDYLAGVQSDVLKSLIKKLRDE